MQHSINVVNNPDLAKYIETHIEGCTVDTMTEEILLQPDTDIECDLLIIDMTSRELTDGILDINIPYNVPIRFYLNEKLLIIHSKEGIEQIIELKGAGTFSTSLMKADPSTIKFCNELLRTGIPLSQIPYAIPPGQPQNDHDTKKIIIPDDPEKMSFGLLYHILKNKLIDVDLHTFREKNNIISEYIDRFSHDIGIPLSSLRTGIEDILQGHNGSLTPEQQNVISELQHHVTRINDLRSETLMLDKLDSGSIVLNKRLTSIHPLLQDVYLRFLPLADKKDQTLDLICLHFSAMIDADKFRSVVENLVGNAVKYTQIGGTIRIHALKEGNDFRITISDNGPGVPVGSEQEIFKRFTRMHKHVANGTGLGLSIVETIVKMHDGLVMYEHRSGGGSCLIVEFPVNG